MINWFLLVVQANHSFCAVFLLCFMKLKLQLAVLAVHHINPCEPA